MTIFFVLFKCIGNCIYWYCVIYSNTTRCVIARVLYTFIFSLTDNILLSGIQIQHYTTRRLRVSGDSCIFRPSECGLIKLWSTDIPQVTFSGLLATSLKNVIDLGVQYSLTSVFWRTILAKHVKFLALFCGTF